MSEQEDQPPVPPKRRRAPSSKTERRNHPRQQAEAASTALPSEQLPLDASAAPSVGKKWGGFPPKDRQTELKGRMEAWEREPNHRNRLGPFAKERLSGADVYWLATLVAGAGDVGIGKQIFDEYYRPLGPHPNRIDLGGLQLNGADLREAQLNGAILVEAQLNGADLREAQLNGASLVKSQLERANLSGAQLERAKLVGAQLNEADLSGTQLEGANLSGAQLEMANLSLAQLNEAILVGAQLKGANLSWAPLNEANLGLAQLKEASLSEAHLEGTILIRAHLEGANLSEAHLEGANLSKAHLTHRMNLRGATCDFRTQLVGADLDETIRAADVVWNGVNLIRLPWGQVPRLGDEATAHEAITTDLATREKRSKTPDERLSDYQAAARAYRQLAIVLRSQGIAEAADRFTYRALVMQRKALWWQLRAREHLAYPKGAPSPQHGTAQKMWGWLKGILTLVPLIGSYLFSLFLATLTGYGFRMSRIILAYGLLILAFGGTYWAIDRHAPHPLTFGQALIVSITAFHGRVFSYNPFTLSDPQIVVTAIEAICGLVIEGLFVAMLVQRFFNR